MAITVTAKRLKGLIKTQLWLYSSEYPSQAMPVGFLGWQTEKSRNPSRPKGQGIPKLGDVQILEATEMNENLATKLRPIGRPAQETRHKNRLLVGNISNYPADGCSVCVVPHVKL